MSVVNTVCTSCVIECAGPLWTSEWQIYNSEVTKVFFFHVFISNYCACKHLENIGIIPMTSYKDVGSWKCIGPAQLPTTQGIGSICSRVGLKRKLIWAPRWREPDESRQWESEGGWRDIIHLVSEWHHPPGAGVTSSTWCQTGIIHPVFYTNMVLGTICPMQLMGGGGHKFSCELWVILQSADGLLDDLSVWPDGLSVINKAETHLIHDCWVCEMVNYVRLRFSSQHMMMYTVLDYLAFILIYLHLFHL